VSRPWTAAVVGVLAVLLLGPAALDPLHRFVGSDWLDAYGTQWFYWWTERRLAGDDAGALLFFPWGKDLYRHTGGNLLDAAIATPLRWALGAPGGTNAFVLLILLSNAWGATRVAAAAGVEERSGRLAAALLGLFNPFALFELQQGRPTQAMLVFPSLFIASLARPAGLRSGLSGGLWLALTGLTYWYYGILGGLLAVLASLARAVGGRPMGEGARLALVGAVSLAVVLPFAAPMLRDLGDGQVPGLLALADTPGPLGRLRLRTVEGDEQGLFVLALSGRGGALIEPDDLRFDPGVRLFGAAHLLAVLAGSLSARRATRRLALAVGAGALVFAVGPVVIVGRDFVANPLYLWGVERLDVLRRWWWPGRSVAWMHLIITMLGALAVQRVARARGRRWGLAAAVGLGAWAAAVPARQGLAPLDWWPAQVSAGIHCLAQPAAGAVIELPYKLGQRPLYHQTIHGRPILNGMLVTKEAFTPPEMVALRNDNSAVALLLALGERDWRHPRDAWTAADLQALRELGYRTVVFRKEGYLRPRPQRDGSVRMESDWPRARRIFAEVGFLVEPVWEDDELALYTLGREVDFTCDATATPD
jgi:hypothetical protein